MCYVFGMCGGVCTVCVRYVEGYVLCVWDVWKGMCYVFGMCGGVCAMCLGCVEGYVLCVEYVEGYVCAVCLGCVEECVLCVWDMWNTCIR